MEMKYIRHSKIGFILWPRTDDLCHSHVAASIRHPKTGAVISAGFCKVHEGAVACWGRSESLNIDSRQDDAEILGQQLGVFPSTRGAVYQSKAGANELRRKVLKDGVPTQWLKAMTDAQVKLIVDALARCILASGIVRTDIDGLTGPQLIMFAADLEEMLAQQFGVTAQGTNATPPASRTSDSLAAAWQQGYTQGVEDERTSEANIGIAGFGAKVNPARQNPYKTRPNDNEAH
jgi:hypothetical protein